MGRRIASEDRETDLLYRMIEIASSPSLDTETVLRGVGDLVSRAVGCETCFLYLWDSGRKRLVLRAAPPPFEHLTGRVELRLGEGIAGWAAEHREAVLLRRDAIADPRYRPIPEVDGERFPAMLSVPVISRTGILIGVINVHGPRAGHFTEQDLRFVENTASLVAGGIENAELLQLAARKEEALAALVRKTIQVQEEERRRVATEIHDGVTQQLVSIWFRVHACQRLLERGQITEGLAELGATKELIDETLADARSAIYNLRPTTLDDLGLVAALNELAARFAAESGVKARVDAPAELRLPPFLETTLYRITQEALTNVKKHAAASRVTVRMTAGRRDVRLVVADDGRGFDVEAFRRSRPTTSFGLAGMRERIELIGGSLDIAARPGRGTKLVIGVPIREEAAQEVVA